MNTFEKLQMFADGGGAAAAGGAEGGGTAAQGTADGAAAAELRKLGVPEDRIEKHMKRTNRKNKRSKREAERARMQAQFPKQQELQTKPVQQNEPGQRLQKPSKTAVQQMAQQPDYRAHYDSLSRQAQALRQRYPDFDLQRELENPVFLKLTGPRVGLSVEDAYMAVHHRELMEAVTRGTRQELSNAIRSGSMRPAEHGMGAKAPSVVTFDYKHATRSQREAFKKQIFDAAARGEKIYPR